jgi:N-acetylmuramoyl-L-alanine amidase
VTSNRVALLLAALLVFLLGAAQPRDLGEVVEVRHWSYPDYTRVVVELDRPVRIKTEVQRLPADRSAKRPERLYLELEGVWVGRAFESGMPVGDGLLEGVRIGQFTSKAIRVVLDLAQYERHRVIALSDPDRLVVDVYGPRKGGESLRWPGKTLRDTPRLPAGLRSIETVVLDPGHGGKDPGAVGIGGVREKDVALNLARELDARLTAKGFRVVLTRDDDRKITLEERTAIAEAERGDIFVSLHANASRRRSTSGVETYYLDENHERHSLTVAARENGVEPSAVNPLQRTLAKLRVSEVSPHSQRLAEHVQEQIVGGMPSRWRPMKDLGAKRGPFYVLFLSTMPAILVEAGFLTNRGDAKRLRSDAYIGAMADQIALALDAYRRGEQTLAYQGAP